jgi:hypothetical protein
MERVIDLMKETLQICKTAQRSMQDASHRKMRRTARPSRTATLSDVYTGQAVKSIQIQFG